jgi:solute carrier family 3 protein 2
MDSEKDKTKGSPEEMEKLTTPTSGGADKSDIRDIDDDKKSPEESKLLEGSGNEVKFIPAADPKNGDAKIDMENVRVVFSGMSKDELMKFANDPFWVRMRWFLFILFWLTWLAMLAGAISIIFFAQKCPAAAPREWWEKGPIVPIDVGSFIADNSVSPGTLKGKKNV